MAQTSMLVGSYPDLPASTITVTDELAAAEAQAVTSAVGDYYMIHTTTAISAVDQVKTAVNAHANIADCAVGLTKSGKIRIYRTGASNFEIAWGSATALRDFLGFSGDLSGASTYTANLSKWFWSPGRDESSRNAILGADGQKLRDVAVGMAGDGTFRASQNNSYRINTFFWRYVAISRIWTTSESGGEFFAFFDEVLAKARQFTLWRQLAEDTTDDTTLLTLSSKLGPYKMSGGLDSFDYTREIANVDRRSAVELPCVQVTELSN